MLRVVQDSAGILLKLLNDVLDLSKVEAGKLQLENVAFDLRTVCGTVAALLKPAAETKGLDLRLSVPDGPTVYRGDPHRLQQIVLNLVSNAVKFTSAGTVSVVAEALEAGDARGTLRLEVADTGAGIEQNRMEDLFAPFVQLDSDTHRKHGGTGLGLAITKALVDAMGGRIEVQSELDRGTRFTILLPLQRLPGLPSQKRRPGEAAVRGPSHVPPPSMHVLVVEDNRVNQRIVVQMLRALGHTPEVAQNGVEALRMVASRDYDAVLMDCQMPEMNGFEATRAVRQKE